MNDECKPWGRQPGEPEHWFRRFQQYLDQEPPRSVLRVYRGYLARKGPERSGKTPLEKIDYFPPTWRAARDKYHWLDRASAYDRDQDEERERLKRKAKVAQEERELRSATLLYDKADELIAFPTVIREEEAIGEDGNLQKITMMSADPIVFRSAALLYREARANARASLKMPTKIIEKETTINQNGLRPLTVIILPDNHRDKPLKEALRYMGEEEEGEIVQQPEPSPIVASLPPRDPLPEE